MRTILEPIQALHQRAAFFLAAPDLRVLLVESDAVMRQPASDHLLGLEFSADNRAVFVRLCAEHSPGEPGWGAWTAEILAEHEARRAAWSRRGVEICPVVQSPPELGDVERFAAALWSIAQLVRTPPLGLDGVVCLLAPERMEPDKALGRALVDLVRTPSLSCVRWILVDTTTRLGGLLSDLGDALLSCECRFDTEANERAVAERLAAAAGAGSKAHPRAKQGAAWPRGVRPPARAGARPPPKGISVPPEFATIAREGEALADIAATVRAAAHAASTGDGVEAVRLQARARDAAISAGLNSHAAQMELVLGSFQLGLPAEEGGGPTAARRTFTRALEGAERQGLYLEAAQAALGLAQLHLLTPDAEQAVDSFRRSAGLAKKAGASALAIEALRAGGQTALTAGALTAASTLWCEGVELALSLAPDKAKATSGAEVARLLAAACRSYSLATRAEEFERIAQRIDEGKGTDEALGAAPPLEEASRPHPTPDAAAESPTGPPLATS